MIEAQCPGTPPNNFPRQLAKNRVSDNVGAVKHFLSILLRALRRARHFALVEGLCHTNQGSLVIYFRFGHSVRPMHLFDRNFDHDYYFELPTEGERDPLSIIRCSTTHHCDLRGLPRANRTLLQLLVIPLLAHHPATSEPLVVVPLRLWQRSSVLVAAPSVTVFTPAIPADSAPTPAPLPPTENAAASCLVS